ATRKSRSPWSVLSRTVTRTPWRLANGSETMTASPSQTPASPPERKRHRGGRDGSTSSATTCAGPRGLCTTTPREVLARATPGVGGDERAAHQQHEEPDEADHDAAGHGENQRPGSEHHQAQPSGAARATAGAALERGAAHHDARRRGGGLERGRQRGQRGGAD